MFSYRSDKKELAIDFSNIEDLAVNSNIEVSLLTELKDRLNIANRKVTALNILNLNKFWLNQFMPAEDIATTQFFQQFNQLLRTANVKTIILTACDISEKLLLLFKNIDFTTLAVYYPSLTPIDYNGAVLKDETSCIRYMEALSKLLTENPHLENFSLQAPFITYGGGIVIGRYADKLYEAIAQSKVTSLTISSDLIQDIAFGFFTSTNPFWNLLPKFNLQHLKLISETPHVYVSDEQIKGITQRINNGKLPSLCNVAIGQELDLNDEQVLTDLKSALQKNRQRLAKAIKGQDAFASILNYTDQRIPAEIAHRIVYFGMFSLFGDKKTAMQQADAVISKALDRSERTPRATVSLPGFGS